MRVSRLVTTLSALALAAGVLPAAANDLGAGAPAGTTASVDGRLVLVLDSSGSMAERSGGTTRIEAAKQGLRDVLDRLPDGAEVGVRVFGATVFSRQDRGACTDTQNVVPVGPLDGGARSSIEAAIEDYEPYGETPIGNALLGAAEDLGPEGRRTIVLLSDGEPTCDPDPCAVARQLRRQGVGLRVNVVGLDVSGRARSALQCIAAAGGGSYFEVRDPEQLAASLVDVSVRSLREFAVSGEPVQGTPTPGTAPAVEPGQYVDTIPPGQETRHYRLVKQPGAGLSASVTMRPDQDGGSSRDTLRLDLRTPDGERCAESYAFRANVLRERAVLSAGASYLPGSLERDPEGCADAEELLLQVDHSGAAGPRDLELLVQDQPAVDSVLVTLPPAVEESDPYEREARAEGEPVPVLGGVGFGDAPELAPGVFVDTVRPGEQLFYRVPVGWGQALRVTFELGADPRAAELLGVPGNTVDALVFNPVRASVQNINFGAERADDGGFYDGAEPARVTASTVPVRLRNGERPFDRFASTSLAGDWTVGLRMGSLDDDTEFAAPVRILVELVGEVEGEPELSGWTPTSTPSPTATTSTSPGPDGAEDEPTTATAEDEEQAEDDGFPAAALAGAAGLLALLAGIGAWVVSRRRDGP